LIEKRYSNEDALGRKKENLMTGRENISLHEIDLFLENPFFGIGVAKGAELRYEESGQIQLSHNEITRMMAEHGTFGILALLILLITPMVMYLNNKQNIFVFSCLIFWLLTINHAAMRIAAPAFIYALSLLKIKMDETPVIHRE
jgi:O-antigen ligase